MHHFNLSGEVDLQSNNMLAIIIAMYSLSILLI